MKNITPPRILDYVEGMVITDTCVVRNMPMDLYHSQQVCSHPSISSTGVRLIESKSLSHFYCTSDLNPDKKVEEPKHHFAWGKALHHLAGGEAHFQKHFAVRPTQWDSWRSKDARTWRAVQQMDRIDVLAPEDLIGLQMAAEKLQAHPTIQAGILTGLIEHSIFVKRRIRVTSGRVITFFLKARPDVIPVDSDMVVDLKSCADASPLGTRKSISNLGYHIQLAIAHEAILAALKRAMTDHVLVFIESEPPCEINIKPIEPLAIEYGRRQLKRALYLFANALDTGVWTGYDDDEVPTGLTKVLMDKLAKEAEDGLLPALTNDPDPEPDPEEEVDAEEEAI
jgi:hypothetical protein